MGSQCLIKNSSGSSPGEHPTRSEAGACPQPWQEPLCPRFAHASIGWVRAVQEHDRGSFGGHLAEIERFRGHMKLARLWREHLAAGCPGELAGVLIART